MALRGVDCCLLLATSGRRCSVQESLALVSHGRQAGLSLLMGWKPGLQGRGAR